MKILTAHAIKNSHKQIFIFLTLVKYLYIF